MSVNPDVRYAKVRAERLLRSMEPRERPDYGTITSDSGETTKIYLGMMTTKRHVPPDCVEIAHDVLYLVGRIEALESAIRHGANPAERYCEGGAQTCEDCRGSCGIEEHEEIVREVCDDDRNP